MCNTKISTNNSTPNLDTICRLCLVPDSGSINIFDTSKLSIPVRIMACAALEVQSTDGLPKFICDKCRFQLEKSYYFRKKCQQSDGKLRKHMRLLNAGKKSRVFQKSDDDDDDDDEDQFEECLTFIRAEEEKLQKEEDEKRQKWLEEKQEQFRKEETQRLFEEFGNFVNSRKPIEPPNPIVCKKEKMDVDINPTNESSPKAQTIAPSASKGDTAPKRAKIRAVPPKQREVATEDEDDHEITSSEQPQEDQEQIWIYNDEEGENQNEAIQTYFLYGKSDEDGNNQIIEIESEHLDELDEELNKDDEAEEAESQLEIPENDDDGSDDFELGTEYEVCENRDERESRLDSANMVESYQIEDSGDIQYLKEENPAETLSISDEDEVRAILDSVEASQYQEASEQKFVMPQKSAKLKCKGADLAKNEQNEEKKFINVPVISVNYAKISTEDLKIFKCSECPQSFTRENSLLRHRSAHKKGREYSCERCDKWFSCKSSLDRHMRIHTGEKPFTCDQCGKSYMQKEVLKRHLAIHSGERPHPCPHCPRAFVQKLLLTQHINATHLEVPQIQKHDCHLCSKSFHHASGLSRHLITHCGMKFRCSECGRSFNDKSSIRRHMLSVHSKCKEKTVIQTAKVSQKTLNLKQSKTDFIM